MNTTSAILLIGVGTSGCEITRGVSRAFGENLRYILADTDARTGQAGGPFVLLGGNRLSGNGAGGDIVQARMATEESVGILDAHLEGVRLAVIATCLGGGTGGGATLEIVKRLQTRGIPSIVFATTPFVHEGETVQRAARGIMSMIEQEANSIFFLPLDKLVLPDDNMKVGMNNVVSTMASAITLFWRLVEKPGFIRLDIERLRHIVTGAGRGRFAVVTTRGEDRAQEAIDRLKRSELLSTASGAVRTIVCGVLAGDDLKLSELGIISEGVQTAFSRNAAFHLSTVNDEETFHDKLSVVTLMFESNENETKSKGEGGLTRNVKKVRNPLTIGPMNRGRFNNVESTIWHGQNLDEPTFIRENISLEF
ncbi:MAG: hypothetical protein MJ109_03605 [Kiritimatiellae bacterium]|nr:hypothetical protein [Kiritimatiellia bacterium]